MLARRHQLDTISRLCPTVLDVKINQDVVVDPNRRVLSVSVITGVLSVPLTRCNPRRSFVVVEFAKDNNPFKREPFGRENTRIFYSWLSSAGIGGFWLVESERICRVISIYDETHDAH